MGMALAAKRGERPASGKVRQVANSMSEKQLHDFAGTPRSDLPKHASARTKLQAAFTLLS